MEAIIIIILLVANIPVYKKVSKFIFKDSEDLRDSVKYAYTPDIYSLFKGRYLKDRIGEFKLSMFIILCFIIISVEFMIIKGVIGLFA